MYDQNQVLVTYRETKPRSNFSIGIGVETLLTETEPFFQKKPQMFVIFSLDGKDVYKLWKNLEISIRIWQEICF